MASTGIETIETLVVSPFGTNCYVVRARVGDLAVVDPGGDAAQILKAVDRLGGALRLILCTHGHLDHIEAAGEVRARAGGKIVLHGEDLPLWQRVGVQAFMFQLPEPEPLPAPDIILAGGERLELGSLPFAAAHVPGHSPGSVAFVFADENIVFNGDTVFSLGVGRADLWGGNGPLLRRSVIETLFTLPDDCVLYPGHGPPVSVRDARQNRPLLEML